MNNSIKVGDNCILLRDIKNYNHIFKKGTIVKITGVDSNGYQFIDSKGNECINAGFKDFAKLIKERTKPCKFCENSGNHRYTYSDDNRRYFLNLFGDCYLRIGIEPLNVTKVPIQNIKINYCPFCGRKLK